MFLLASFPLTVELVGRLPGLNQSLIFLVVGSFNMLIVCYAMNWLLWLIVPYEFAWFLMGRKYVTSSERLDQPETIYEICKSLGLGGSLRGFAVTAYLGLIFIWALVHFKVTSNPQSLAEYLNEVGMAKEHDQVYLRLTYLYSIPFGALPLGFYPAGFWLMDGRFGPFLAFIPSALMVGWYRRNIMNGVPIWFTCAMHILGGFPLVCYMLQCLPNLYQLPMFILASAFAMGTYHFLLIVVAGMIFQNTAKGILKFFGLKISES